MQNSIAFLEEMLRDEQRAVAQLLGALERAKTSGAWNQPEVFADILIVGMRRAGVSAADLSKAEDVSRSAVSKWVNREATPPRPTRKTVLLWLEQTLKNRAEELGIEIAERCQSDECAVLAS